MRPGDRPLKAVALLLGSLLLMAVMSALVKLVSERQPLSEIMLFRFAGSLLPLVWVLARSGGVSALRTGQPMQHLIRSILGTAGIGLYFSALATIPIADATALTYSAPMFLSLFAVPLLGERVRMDTWLAVAVGFGGMLLIASPRGHGIGVGTAAAIGSAVFGALVSVWIRKLSAQDAPITIAVFYNAFGFVVSLAWVVGAREFPVFDADIAIMAAVGVMAGAQQYLMTSSFRYAEASFLAPLQYVLLVFAGIVGWVFWGEVPTPAAIAGALIITASGVFIVRRGRRRA